MEKYELMTIVDAALSQEEKASIVKEISDSITKSKGKVINSQQWLDKHKLSFRLKGRYEGAYHLFNFEGPMSGITNLRHLLRINEKIMRHLIIRVE